MTVPPSATPPPAANGAQDQPWFDTLRGDVDGFVGAHFTWPGTFRLHRAALGWDILRAPFNVVLAPVFVLSRLLAYLLRKVGWRSGADWLARRRILLRTAVARRVEACIATDFLDLTLTDGTPGREALARAVLAAPHLREMIRRHDSTASADALGLCVADAIGDYAGTRSAVAEMTTVLFTLLIGALVFQALTPGMISMAPGVADAVARAAAIADFPLGRTLGGVWVGAFGAGADPWLVAVTVFALVMVGAVFAAFAGVLADPVQTRLGIHRRRLLRLIDTLEGALGGQGDKPFAAREHYYARLLDLWDAGASLLRILRG